MESVLQDLATRDAPHEIWFLKFNAGDMAFLVDFIVQRRLRQAELRLSFWVRGRGRVERSFFPGWHIGGPNVAIAGCTLAPDASCGRLGDVQWDLTFDAGAERVDPQHRPISLLRPFDMELISRPCARFRGSVAIGEELFAVDNVAGLVTHYWGRRLPHRWHWVSANQFEGADIALEATVLHSRLWGLPGPKPAVGYFYLFQSGQCDAIISPLTGTIRVAGQPHDFTLVARRYTGGPAYRLRCTTPPESYNDVDTGIRQSLVGTCRIEGLATACGTAGLEIRRPVGSKQ